MLKTDYDIPIFKDEDIADLNEYSNEMASALKTQLDKFGNPLVYKGKVATLEELPNEAESGNIYSVISENKNYIYNGTEWVEYSSTLDLTYLENNTKTTQTTEVSEELTIENCAGVKGKLDIKNGKTIQAEGTPSPSNIIPIRNVGDNINLFDKDNANVLNAYINGDVITSATNNRLIYISVKENKTYSIKKHKGLGVLRVATSINIPKIGDTVNNVQNFSSLEATYTIPSGEKYLIVFLYRDADMNGGFTLQDILDNFKIEESSEEISIAIPYTPYNCGSTDFQLSNEDNSQSRIVSFPFTAGQRLHIGDYLASDGIHNIRKTYVFTGEEDFDMGTINGLNYFINKTATSDFKYIDDNTCNYICNSFVAIKVSERWQDNTLYINGSKKITITSNNFTSVEELKTFLATQYANGTPVTIEYELAEEIITRYTTEQEQAYYELQHLLMYEGYTSIECIDEIKPDIQLTYWYNNELNKSYGERFDKVEDSINELEKGEIYSTEEQEIGKWIDGKPLYRRTIILDKPSSIEISNINEYNLLYDNDSFWSKLDFAMIDKTHSFILSNTVNNFNNATLTQEISGTQNENWWFDLRSYNKVNKTIQVCIGQTLINRFWKIYATLEYTKTTD